MIRRSYPWRKNTISCQPPQESCPSCPAEGQQQPLEKLEAMSAAVLVSVEEAAPQLQEYYVRLAQEAKQSEKPSEALDEEVRPGDRYP